jgi:hypothetical protein
VDASGVYVAGSTYGTLPGQHRRGEDDVFVRRYGTEGKEVWTRQFGSRDEDYTSGVAAGPRGVYVIGTTYGSFKGETNAGRSDAFVAALAPDGSKLWKEEFGTPLSDEASDADVEGSRIYITGDGQQAVAGSRHANSEAFVRSYGLDGVERWEKHFGTDGHDSARAIDVVPGPNPRLPAGAYVLGTTTGAFPGQRRVGKADLFLVRIAA